MIAEKQYDNPLGEIDNVFNQFTEIIGFGFIPIGDFDGFGPLCLDIKNVYCIDNIVSSFIRSCEVVSANSPTNCNLQVIPQEDELERYYYTVDEQGSIALITDGNLAVKNEYYFDAFGKVINANESVHNVITYTGQQFDSITQQYYLRARYYNPVIGRFTQEYVYRGDGLNLYAYCRNNTVSIMIQVDMLKRKITLKKSKPKRNLLRGLHKLK